VARVVVGVAALAVTYAILFLNQGRVDSMLEEDGVVEYVGAAGLLLASLFFFVAFVRSRRGPSSRFHRIKRLSLIVLALVFLVGAGEEISWGQRLLGFGTPEAVSEANSQDEITVHNLTALEGWLEIERLFQLFWIAFAVIVPVACAVSARTRTWLERLIPILPLWIAALFVANQACAEIVDAVFSSSPDLYRGTIPLDQGRFEITETNVALLFALAAFVVLRDVTGVRARPPDRAEATKAAAGESLPTRT
jgi:hypothetical protein